MMTVRRGLRWSKEQFARRNAPIGDAPAREPARVPARSSAGGRQRRREPSDTGPLERDVLAAVLAALRMHPRVAWCERMNTGQAVYDKGGPNERRVRFAWPGCSDIVGQMKTGEWLAVEVKGPTGRLTADQAAFLRRVIVNGGLAFLARSVDDVFAALRSAVGGSSI
jgi:hypothetical protein